jgi:hypothetical protein
MRKYLTVTETAKLVRKDLKAAFPATKFGVTCDKYAGGASIRVKWTDGPTVPQVDAVIGIYESRGFDGMVDYEYHKTAWMMPDGTVTRAYREDTTGCKGVVEGCNNPKPHPDAVEVSFGASYVTTDREITEEARAKVRNRLAQEWGVELDGTPDWNLRVENAGDYMGTLIHREMYNLPL